MQWLRLSVAGLLAVFGQLSTTSFHAPSAFSGVVEQNEAVQPLETDAENEMRIGQGIDRAERIALREEVREMFYHGYNNYLT